MVSLLMLATLLVYNALGSAGPLPLRHPPVQSGQTLSATPAEATATEDAAAGGSSCTDAAAVAGDACCDAVQCTAMHSGLPAPAFDLAVPPLDTSNDPAALSMPDGIGGAPALRPPSPTI